MLLVSTAIIFKSLNGVCTLDFGSTHYDLVYAPGQQSSSQKTFCMVVFSPLLQVHAAYTVCVQWRNIILDSDTKHSLHRAFHTHLLHSQSSLLKMQR
jgi:hypothetical protein